MHKITFILAAILLLSACASSKKLLEKGQYDDALIKAAKEIRENPTDQEELYVFQHSYTTANQLNRNTIKLLKLEGNPKDYLKIYHLYENIWYRQRLAKSLPKTQMQLSYRDVADKMIAYKKKAALFFYETGNELLRENTRQSARKAYSKFMACKELIPNYKNINHKINRTLFLGTTNVIISGSNSSQISLPPEFFNTLLSIRTDEINQKWINFDTRENPNIHYDNEVLIDIQSIYISPERITEIPFQEAIEIPDGYDYVLDRRGNVKKDSLGNDIKTPKYKTIVSQLLDVGRKKKVQIRGEIVFFDNASGQEIKVEKITGYALFENHTYKLISGNTNSLSKKTQSLLKKPILPFPPNALILMRATENLKFVSKNSILANTHIFQ